MKKILVMFGATAAMAIAAAAETASMRIVWGSPAKPSRLETREIELLRQDDGAFRFKVAKSDIPADAFCVEVVPDFMTAQKGDDGWWMQARGTYGRFTRDEGFYLADRQLMPIYAVKRGDSLHHAHVRTWRFHYDFVTRAVAGRYETFARFRCDKVRKVFGDYYSDIVVDFYRQGDRDYVAVAEFYRNCQLKSGAVRTIKDRIRDYPELDYLCDAIVVRIQTHAAKPIPETVDGIEKKFFRQGEELPVVVHMPFGVTEEFLQALKDAGVDKLSICSAGWQDGGYDGRTPWHFPVGANAGGAEAFDRLIARAKKLGYQFALHATNTDGYMCSSLWDEDWVCKDAAGELQKGGIWAGGQCYWVCQQCAWERWIPKEMKMMAALGIRGPHYVDVYSATYPIPCGDKRHLCTPEKTAEYQNRILAYGKELMGGASSESGYDHVAGNIDYINYIERDLQLIKRGKHNKLVDGVYPLWELVYHGIILYNSDRLTQNHTRGKCLYKLEKSGDPRWMEGDGIEDPYVALKIVEFGGRPIFYTYKFADVPRIRKAWDEFVPVRHLQRELMVSHKELQKDVFETRYGDGSRTLCNYRAAAASVGGVTVPSLGYVLFAPDGKVQYQESFKKQ
jgi:hypothetical protein